MLEFGENGNLHQYLNAHKKLYSLQNQLNVHIMFYKIALGVKAIHSLNRCHADLKLENIVIDRHNIPKIIDFQTVSFVGQEELCHRGSTLYLDPEVIESILQGKRMCLFNEMNDVYSLGVILYYMLY